MFYAWLVVRRLVELAAVAFCLFAVPEDRLERVIVGSAAVLWLGLRHQQISNAVALQGFMQPILQMLRFGLAHMAHGERRTSDEDLRRDFEYIQENVGIGNSDVLSDKYAYLRRPVSLGDLRATVEQTWFDSFIAFNRRPTMMVIEGGFAICRTALVVTAVVKLL
jgi:hypothetical protein